MAGISFNPLPTTTAAGSFGITSSGYIQGTAQQDPNIRNQLAGGIVGPNETLPMWGGVLISESTTPLGTATNLPERSLGGYITRATSYPTSLYTPSGTAGKATGFSVFDQDHAMINFPQSPVPTAQSGMLANFYRFGSGARIAVNMSASLVSQEGLIITQPVSWDLTAQELVPYEAGYSQNTITGAVWAATAGGQTAFTVSTDITADLAVGDFVTVATVVNTGGTSTSAFNGEWLVVAVTSTVVTVAQPAASSPGTYASGGYIAAAAGGALPVRVLDVNIGGSMTVNYSSVTGFATWNRSGSCAIIQI